jgi:hypothetical protein
MKLSTEVLNTNLSSFVQIGAGKGRTFHVGVIGVAVTGACRGTAWYFGSKERLCTTSRSAPFAFFFVQVSAIWYNVRGGCEAAVNKGSQTAFGNCLLCSYLLYLVYITSAWPKRAPKGGGGGGVAGLESPQIRNVTPCDLNYVNHGTCSDICVYVKCSCQQCYVTVIFMAWILCSLRVRPPRS